MEYNGYMFNLFKKEKQETEAFFEMFPPDLKSDAEIVARLIPKSERLPLKTDQVLLVNDDSIRIYSRIYNPEPDAISIGSLTVIQLLVLSCIYTRHHDGYIRQKYLNKIIENEKYWTVPFVVVLLGEYVVEIIEVARESIKKDNALYKKFITENPAFWEKTKERMISYWNEYYRKSYRNKDVYPALDIAKTIEG